MRDYFN
jgi:hypothetical protein